jgi:hypothetical protein
MSRGQRVILSIALAAALIAIASAINARVVGDSAVGWFMYAPNANALTPLASTNNYVWQQLGVWLIAIGVWFVASWRLFRTRDE